jgi:uncharacterized protein YcbK (DUF882 family)
MNDVARRRKKRRLKKSVKKTLLLILISIVLIVSIPFVMKKWIESSKPQDVGIVRVDRFRDLNALHLKHARANGIEPIVKDNEVDEIANKLIKQNNLKKLEDTRYYKVDKLSHSHPYLTPETIDMLNLLGKRFHQKLAEKKMGKYKFRVSSVLRTHESQKRLSRTNINATSESSHLYGTTLDIGWKKIYKETLWGGTHLVADGPAIKILSETIGDLRKEGYLVVITEMKEACFHITSVQKK